MITKFNIFENYVSTYADFKFLEAGDILIAKSDVYIRHFTGSMKWMTPIIGYYGDKLFIKKGRTKKVSKIDHNGIHLSGFSPGISVEFLHEFFIIKDIELKKSMNKYNL